MAAVVAQAVGGLAVVAPWIIICRAYAKRTEATAELIEAPGPARAGNPQPESRGR